MQTILTLLDISSKVLEERGIEDARLNAELLLCHVLQCKRIDLYLRYDRALEDREVNQYRELVRRRLNREPVQYITGETEFMGLRLAVDPRVLIPRPETELLVEGVVDVWKSEHPEKFSVLDIGTGSGNIAISLVKMISVCTVESIDNSPGALEVAAGNVGMHDCRDRITLRQLDFLKDRSLLKPYFDCIVSNPPYIPVIEAEEIQPEVRIYEPRTALSDGADGMTFYRAIADEGSRLLRKGGWTFVEVGFGQHEDVERLFRENGFGRISVIKDYSGIERIIKAQR